MFEEIWIQVKAPIHQDKTLQPVCESSLVSYKCHLYSFGGYSKRLTGSDYYNCLVKYSISANRWEVVQQQGSIPAPRSSHSALVYENFLYIFGGTDGTDTSEIRIFNLETETWIDTDSTVLNGPSPRYGHSACLHGDYMVIYGGYNAKVGCLNDVWSWSFKESKWIELEIKTTLPKVVHHASVVHGNFMFVYGGYQDTLYFDHFLKINLLSLTHETVNYSGEGPSKISNHQMVILDNLIFLFGGNRYGYCVPDLFQLDLDTFNWYKVTTMKNPPGRWGHSSCLVNHRLYSYAGIDESGSLTSDLWKFSFGPHRTMFFKKFLGNEKYADVKITVGEKVYPCHRVVLAQSKFLKRGMEKGDFTLDSVSPVVFEKVMYYLYSSFVSLEGVDILEFAKAAIIFEMEDLETQCIVAFRKSLTIANIFESLIKAHALGGMIAYMQLGYSFFWKNSKSASNVSLPDDILIDLLNNQKVKLRINRRKPDDQKRIFEYLSSLSSDPNSFSDLTIRSVDGVDIRAHRIIMDLFGRYIQDSTLPTTVLEVVLSFAYSRQVVLPNNVIDAFNTYNLLEIHRMDEILEPYAEKVKGMITSENVIDVVQFCVRNKVKGVLMTHAYEMLGSNRVGTQQKLVEMQFNQQLELESHKAKIDELSHVVKLQSAQIQRLLNPNSIVEIEIDSKSPKVESSVKQVGEIVCEIQSIQVEQTKVRLPDVEKEGARNPMTDNVEEKLSTSMKIDEDNGVKTHDDGLNVEDKQTIDDSNGSVVGSVRSDVTEVNTSPRSNIGDIVQGDLTKESESEGESEKEPDQ